MADYPTIAPYTGKKGPATYKAALANKKQSGASRKLKKAQRDNVAKKVKKISNKVMGLKKKSVVPGPAAHSTTYGGNNA